MIDGAIDDFQFAKKKAAERLRINDKQSLPSNDEIEAEVSSYQRLFRGQTQPLRLLELRRVAIEAMSFLARFQPRLVGSVLTGTAHERSGVCLHLFSEPHEAVSLFLTDNAMPFDFCERRLRVAPAEQRGFPALSFMADDIAVELVVFELDSQRNPPLCPVDGKPMKRANLDTVNALIDCSG
jgi:hypothetical protein